MQLHKAAGLMLAFGLALAPGAYAKDLNWVRTIGTSVRFVDPAKADTVENQTVRFPVRLTLGGDTFRLSLSNEHGPTDMHIGAATLSYMDGSKEVFVPVTFAGHKDVVIAANAPALSDEIKVPLGNQQVINISLYFPEKTALSTFHGDRNPTAVSGPGDFTTVETAQFPTAASFKTRPVFSGLDVAVDGAKTIVAYGDSITDSGDDVTKPVARWSDELAERLMGAHKLYGVANESIGGNRILHENTGTNALARFDRDVLSLPNVGYVVMLEGINDIGNSGAIVNGAPSWDITADALIAGYKQIVARAHEHGIKVYVSQILPFMGAKYSSEDKDKVRQAVNAWILTPGNVDGVVGFNGAVADPANPVQLNPALERGDHLHPNDDGERAMGKAIDLKLFK
jgi:lysophospholipase L1-like esterase